jgi:hypothetical protein
VLDDIDRMTRIAAELSDRELHERLMSWFVGESYRQASNREQMAKCEQYYDQHQTDQERRRAIEARGQTVVQYDMITPQIDWLLGTERRMRIDEKIMPRDTLDEATSADAEAKTHLLKWIDDTNRTGYQRSAAWDDAMKAGQGWLEVFAYRDHHGKWCVGKQAVPWKHCLYDSLGLEKTGTEKMRFFFRLKTVDLDIAISHFPKKRRELMMVANSATGLQDLRSWMSVPGSMFDLESMMGRLDNMPDTAMPTDLFNARQRVMLVECWSLEPYREQTDNPALDAPIRFRPAVTIMTEFDIIWRGWSPYKHDRIPFVPYWAFADKTTGLPYSLIKRLIPRQDALNKVMSRALHDISTDQLHIEEGAWDDEVMTLEEIRDELDDPGGIPIFKKNSMKDGSVKTVKNTESAEAHMNFANKITESLQQSAAVNRESTGGGLPGVSGVALGKREDQSTLQTAEFFDGLVLAHMMEGELTLSVAEQFMVHPMVVPAKDARGVPIAVPLNQPQADGSIYNDMCAMSARYIITEQPWRASLGQAQFESLMLVLKELAGPAPQVVMALLDTVFEYADIPNKQQIVERIRSVTGQQAPDAKPTPDQIEMAQRKKILADLEFQKAYVNLKAAIEAPDAKNQKDNADKLVKLLEALGLASTVALQAAQNPLLTPATDAILRTVGFPDQSAAAGGNPATMPAAAPAQPGMLPAPANDTPIGVTALNPRPPQPIPMMTPPKPAPLPYPGNN